MAKFRKKTYRTHRFYGPKHSTEWLNERKSELYAALENAKTDAERDLAYKAYETTVRPFQR